MSTRSNYDSLLIPGGRSPESFRLSGKVLAITKKVFSCEQANSCGVPPCASAGIIRSKLIGVNPAIRTEVALGGATFAQIAIDTAVTDGQFVPRATLACASILDCAIYCLPKHSDQPLAIHCTCSYA